MKKCALFFILFVVVLLIASLTDKKKGLRGVDKIAVQGMGKGETLINPLTGNALDEE